MSGQASIAFHEVAASFNEEQWMRLDNHQKDAYRKAIKDIHETLIAQGYTILNPSVIFSIQKQDESYVRIDSHSMEKKSAIVGDFPDILMKIKEEPDGETPISQGEHCVNQPSTSSGPASSCNIKQEDSTYGPISSGAENKLADSPPRTSNAVLIKTEEEGFSIDDYNSAGGEATPGNSAGFPAVIKQEPDDGDEEETDNEDLENIIPVIVKQEEPDPARNDQADKKPPVRHSANITNPIIGLIDEAILLMVLRRRRRLRELEEKRSRRRYRAHPLMSQRLKESFFPAMYRDLRKYPKRFFNFTQMSISTFDALLEVLRPRLARMDTSMWRNVSAEERLLVTLRFLSSGQTFESLHHCFQLGVSSVARVAQETCLALWKELHQVMMPEPTEELWKELAEEFWEQAQFPNCIGALDGKHIRVKMPPNQQSKCSSIVLLGLVDSHCRFVAVDVGAYGSAGDSHIFKESTMGRRLFEGRLRIPPGEPLPCTKQPSLPNVIVTDKAFGLTENLMCPYSGRELTHKEKIFNYRLSCVHRMVKCAFRVCTTKWRILLSTIPLDVERAIKVVLACCVLHNFVIERERVSSYPAPQNASEDVQFMDSHPTMYAMSIRNAFADFFVAPEGRVSWQNDYI